MNVQPAKHCDLVMKGGITSGVVYPHAVTEIARSFTLKSVGGTSAGAIAAAAAAAAEIGRMRGGSSGEFKLLEGLPDFLQHENDSGHTNLFTFFQPQPRTRRLFNVLTAALNCNSPVQIIGRVVCALVGQYWWVAATGALPGVLLALLAWRSNAGPLTGVTLLLGIALAGSGMVLFPAIELVIGFGRRVPENLFGLCSGMPSDAEAAKAPCGSPDGHGAALAVWLTQYLNRLAGFDPNGTPLTFGQLWNPTIAVGERPPDEPRAVQLEMLTTCLTWGRPFRLPFQDEEKAKENRFYFRIAEFEKLFPENVVKWLREHPRESELPECWQKQGFVPLPEPWNLPVIVATRMSLSFPILLSAIPLYSYDQEATKEFREQNPPPRCWFSDGGVCSNFPMHFFDSPLPRWPTFAVNLVPKPDGTPQTELAKPWMPLKNNQGIQESWNNFDATTGLGSIFRFVGAIIGTMQNWSDNSLLRIPGYRDRIAHVGLTSSEGGLNLDMPKERIETLGQRGAAAGREFVRRFASDEEKTMNWQNHRWLRLRSTLASLEEMLKRFECGCAQPLAGDSGYEDWLRQTARGQEPSYAWRNQEQRAAALVAIQQLRALARQLSANPDSLEVGAPRPRPELRPRPRI